MTRKIDFEMIDANTYREVEIEVYEQTDISSKTYEHIDTIKLNDNATLEPYYDEDSSDWILRLDDDSDRETLLDIHILRFVVSIYELDEDDPFGVGKLIMKTPLIDRYFFRPEDESMRGKGSTVNLVVKNKQFYDIQELEIEDDE